MTRPALRRHAWDSVDSDLFERQEAALSHWAEELRRKQRLFAERERVFEGTRLALGGPRRRRGPPPAASPALEHSPWRVGVTGRASAAHPPAAPLLARPPAVLLSGPSTSPGRSDAASHLGSGEAFSLGGSAVSAREKQGSRRRRSSCLEQQDQSASKMDFFLSPNPETVHHPPKPKTVYCDYILDYPTNTHHPTSEETVFLSSQATARDLNPTEPSDFSHSITISSPVTHPLAANRAAQSLPSPPSAQPIPVAPPRVDRVQLAPTPVPAPRTRAAVTQSTSTPVPVSRVGVTGVQPPPAPVPAPRLRAARIRPDPPRDSAEAL
ncbi:myb-related transcription factor, partner of profilin-like [Pundamilia nyererei]|uniref:Myb-related transcription factor, partner of profilin-like n=1 Tax=Pundamilia nyererei TaxID=303518 RepID=A0A9Y6M1K5_9CICH|nr:PREDICTED: myb-related transcription factor, partner of profilin-like [Pundamilia nyererei]